MDIFAMDKAILSCFKKYAKFSGRATRFEYWSFVLFQLLVSFFVSLIPFAGTAVSGIITLVCFIPNLSVSWRRLHDTGRSGLFTFLPYIGLLFLIPVAIISVNCIDFEDIVESSVIFLILFGVVTLALSIVVIVFMCKKSQPGTNKYGDEPVHTSFEDEKKTNGNAENLEELRKLNQMKEENLISEEDYQKKKNELLGL